MVDFTVCSFRHTYELLWGAVGPTRLPRFTETEFRMLARLPHFTETEFRMLVRLPRFTETEFRYQLSGPPGSPASLKQSSEC